jgi:hypothetical protein
MLNGRLRLRFCDLPLTIWYYLYLILEDHMKIIALVGILALVAFDPTVSTAKPKTTAQVNQKSSHAKHRRAQTNNPYWRLEPYRSMGFIGAYPGEYARRKAAGECVIDMGYGRYDSCSVGGGR